MKKLKLNIQMFADGEIVIKTALDESGFKNGLNKMQGKTQKFGTSIKNIVASLGISSIIGKAVGMINSSLDGAISRFDTLNNYVNVMGNLGVASEEAQNSIEKLSKGITGLPTTLDASALGVQRLTASNKDINKSTKYFLALNDAIVAGGASTEIQNTAIEQLMQSYSKGKPDMMEWRSLLTAMPAQLDQVATSMGYVGQSDLYAALQNGAISMDDFLNAIVKLDTEGGNGIKSFQEQAQTAVGGIGTSITNAKTAVTRGVTSMIDDINSGLEKSGLGSIASIISNLGKNAETALKNIGNIIGGLISGDLSFSELGNNISNSLEDVIPKVAEFITNFINKMTEKMPEIISAGVQIVTTLISGISATMPEIIKSAISLITTLVISLLDNIDQIIDAAIDLIIGLTDGLMEALPILIEKIPEIIEKMVTKLTDPAMLEKIAKAAGILIGKLAAGLIVAIPSLILALAKIGKIIIDYFKNLPKMLIEVGKNVVKGIWEGISGSFDWIKKKLKEWMGNVVDFIKKVFKIKSPSRLMRDEVGIYLAQGVGVGFDEALSDVYKGMQHAINMEQAKLQANVETGSVFNSLTKTTPIVINTNATVEMDSQKVGRLVTPAVSRTLKTGGAY